MNKLTETEMEKIEILTKHYSSTGELRNNWNRFNYCQAWVSDVIYNSAYNKTFQLVKSYNTIVGFIDRDEQKYIALGKWSRTTSKQQTQIRNQLYRNYEFIQL